MEQILASWERLRASSAVLRFVDVNVRGIGQVMFQNKSGRQGPAGGRRRK